MPTLRIQLPDQSEVTHSLIGDHITIGRRPDNTIQIIDPSISAHHAELIAVDGHYRLHDLGSTNLTFVDGVSVTDFHLHTARRISFGIVDCEFDPNARAEPLHFTTAQMEKDIDFLHGENADLRGKINALQRRIDILSSARLVTTRTETTPFAAASDALRAVSGEREDLRHQNTALKLELENLREELRENKREREDARRICDELRADKAALLRELQDARNPLGDATGARFDPPRAGTANGTATLPVSFAVSPASAHAAAAASHSPAAINSTQKVVLPLPPALQPIADALEPIRAALDRFAAAPADRSALAGLPDSASQLVRSAIALHDHPVSRLASSIEALAHDLAARPAPVDPAAARTLAQAADLIAVLLDPRHLERAKSLPHPSVLAVESDADFLGTLCVSLELAHLQITGCAARDEALSLAEAKPYDLVLLDFTPGGIDGPALCAQLRELPAYRKNADRLPHHARFAGSSRSIQPARRHGFRRKTGEHRGTHRQSADVDFEESIPDHVRNLAILKIRP